jgi:hypothetical protein
VGRELDLWLRRAAPHRIVVVEATAHRALVPQSGKLVAERLTGHVFEVAVAVSWALVGLSYLPSPSDTADHSPVGRNLGTFSVVWSVLFIVGAIGVVWGVSRLQKRWRVAGLVLLATGLLMEGIGAATFEFSPRVLVYFVYCAACASRAYLLTAEHRRGV